MISRGLAVSTMFAIAVRSVLAGDGAIAPCAVLSPVQDGFVRFADPTLSYGAAGGMHVAGAGAGNEDGVQQGVADAWMQFDVAPAVEQFDGVFGAGNWVLHSASLAVSEVAIPMNSLYGRGVGGFTVDWVANDDWSAGAGIPRAPGLASSNTIGYTTARMLRDESIDETLGTFSNTGGDQVFSLELEVSEGFAADVLGGGLVTLNLVANDPRIGFTFHSSNRKLVDTRQPPTLALIATSADGVDEGDPIAEECDGITDGDGGVADDGGAVDGDQGDDDPEDEPDDPLADSGDPDRPTDESGDGSDGTPPVSDDGTVDTGTGPDVSPEGDPNTDPPVTVPLTGCGAGAIAVFPAMLAGLSLVAHAPPRRRLRREPPPNEEG